MDQHILKNRFSHLSCDYAADYSTANITNAPKSHFIKVAFGVLNCSYV